MIDEQDYAIGDPVEVRRVGAAASPMLLRPDMGTLAPDVPVRTQEYWQPATVVAVYSHQLSVAFADGERMAIQRRSVRPMQRKGKA